MVSRRDFLKYSAISVPAVQLAACGGGGDGSPEVVEWPIAKDVFTTAEQQICPVPLIVTTPPINANELPYSKYGYNAWASQPGLQHLKLTSLAPGYSGAPNAARLLSYFSISDVHITDKESPAQPL